MSKKSKTNKTANPPITRIGIEDALDKLIAGFDRCRLLSAGELRTEKGRIWEDFFIQVILNAINIKHPYYSVHKGYKVPIEGEVSVTMDVTVLNERGLPVVHAESKDYTDLSMYKRFATDNYLLFQKYPQMKFISLSGWVASSESNQAIIDLLFGINESTISDSLLFDKRKSDDKLFILDHSRDELLKATQALIERLSKDI